MKKIALILLLTSMASFAGGIDAGTGNVLGKTDNMNIVGPGGPRTNVNLTPGHAGAVGQMDWSHFSPAQGAQNANVNFSFEGLQQSVIQRAEGGKTQDILNKITPASGTLNVTTTPEDVMGANQMNNIDFSGIKQTPIQRVEGGKTQDILNKITPAAGEYTYATSQNGNIVIENWNISR